MKLIAGLGNPGSEYAKTRHNAGFMTVDLLVERLGLGGWEQKYRSFILCVKVGGEEVIFLKPLTFMNRSGEAIGAVISDYGIAPEDVLVAHDDIDIPAGDVRYKVGGGHGGHNGLRSIIDVACVRDFIRVRIGVGRSSEGYGVTDHVLGEFSGQETEIMQDSFAKGASFIEEKFLGMVDTK